jgi:bifunctional DNA-binding transcriptional regulator/antitoxin component of YhaV-PrlF toxin-antitoxin module
MWYVSHMSHITSPSHEGYAVRLGDRGRLVLPAELRRALGFLAGDELVARLDGDGVRIVSRRQLARQARGLLRATAKQRDLVAELLAERRQEVAQE